MPSTASLPAICLPKNNPWLRRTAETAESRSQEAAVDDTQRASKRTGDGVLGLREVTKVKEGSDDSDEEGEMASELAELRDRKRLREMMENEVTGRRFSSCVPPQIISSAEYLNDSLPNRVF